MLLKIALVISLSLGLGNTLGVANCPHPPYGYVQFHNDMCYWFVTDHLKTFWDALSICEKWSDTLVIIKSKELNDYIKSKLNDYKIEHNAWIGLTDVHEEGKFFWVDGTPADESFTNWGSLEGSEWFTSEDCVTINPASGTWHDDHCDENWLFSENERPFICQAKPVAPATMPTTSSSTNVKTTPIATTQAPTTQASSTTLAPTTQASSTTLAPTTQASSTTLASTTQASSTTLASTTQASSTTAPTTLVPTCPPFVCELDCDMDGYKIDTRGCSICECDVE